MLLILLILNQISALKCYEKDVSFDFMRIRERSVPSACISYHKKNVNPVGKSSHYGNIPLYPAINCSSWLAIPDKMIKTCCPTDYCNYNPLFQSYSLCAVGQQNITDLSQRMYSNLSVEWTDTNTWICTKRLNGTIMTYYRANKDDVPRFCTFERFSCCEANPNYACNSPPGLLTYLGLTSLEWPQLHPQEYTSVGKASVETSTGQIGYGARSTVSHILLFMTALLL
jgi:hypothetical protein